MSYEACNRGCFCCSSRGDNVEHAPGCCNSYSCDSNAWDEQVQAWLEAELRMWLDAEVAFLEELEDKPKVYVRRKRMEELNPVETRAKTKQTSRAHHHVAQR